jgi:hypothetical protein
MFTRAYRTVSTWVPANYRNLKSLTTTNSVPIPYPSYSYQYFFSTFFHPFYFLAVSLISSCLLSFYFIFRLIPLLCFPFYFPYSIFFFPPPALFLVAFVYSPLSYSRLMTVSPYGYYYYQPIVSTSGYVTYSSSSWHLHPQFLFSLLLVPMYCLSLLVS